jgi:hypothetical protein
MQAGRGGGVRWGFKYPSCSNDRNFACNQLVTSAFVNMLLRRRPLIRKSPEVEALMCLFSNGFSTLFTCIDIER